MSKYIVIGMQSYDFKDDSSGRSVKGTNIYFIEKSQSKDFSGYKTGKISIPDSLVKSFTALPGFYDLDFDVKVGAGGKVTAAISSVQFLSTADIVELKK